MTDQLTDELMKRLLDRRKFLAATALTGSSLLLGSRGSAQDAATTSTAAAPTVSTPNANALKCGIIGVGSQGRVLINAALKVPDIRFVAVADIWEYSRDYAGKILKKFGQPVNVYEDYKEMLAKEKLDAVFIATPDWVHSPITVDCLTAGLHVYCEKEMSNTVEAARAMVKAAQASGKLLQIGHQRRSNPRYLHATKMIGNDKILGRMTAINGQWNRPVMEPLGWPQKFTMTDEQLKKWGYENMNQFVNWRWYKKYAGGPIIDLGSHQIDVYNWYTGVPPKSVVASGGTDYYKDGREWYDNVMCIYEYPAATGTVRAFYQVLNTTSHGGFYETFMGDEGSLEISEDQKVGHMFREVRAKKREWEDLSEKVDKLGKDALELKIGETRTASGAKPPEVMKAEADMKKPEHQPHVENFVYAIRGKEKLNCPGEVGFETCVTTLKVNDAIEQKRAIEFKPEEFKA